MMMCNVVFMEFVDMAPIIYDMWKYERAMGCMKNQLLGSFFEKLFWQQIRLSYDTFCSLILWLWVQVFNEKIYK
jgi:hypothetical protein